MEYRGNDLEDAVEVSHIYVQAQNGQAEKPTKESMKD